MTQPTGIFCVIPSRLQTGETFAVKVRVLGPVREIPCAGGWRTWKPGLRGPFNLNVQRRIQYMDNCLPEWSGRIAVERSGLEGAGYLAFDGMSQGVFPDDRRPIKVFAGFRWTAPGFHFLARLTICRH